MLSGLGMLKFSWLPEEREVVVDRVVAVPVEPVGLSNKLFRYLRVLIRLSSAPVGPGETMVLPGGKETTQLDLALPATAEGSAVELAPQATTVATAVRVGVLRLQEMVGLQLNHPVSEMTAEMLLEMVTFLAGVEEAQEQPVAMPLTVRRLLEMAETA